MLTASDIQHKEFQKAVRGYKEEDVDAFLDEIIADFQSMTEKIAFLEDQLSQANAKLTEYKSTEGAVLTTLESAKSLMNDIAKSAEKRAEVLIKNAELDAELKVRQANEDIFQLRAEEAKLRNRVKSLHQKWAALLAEESARADNFEKEIFGDK